MNNRGAFPSLDSLHLWPLPNPIKPREIHQIHPAKIHGQNAVRTHYHHIFSFVISYRGSSMNT